MFKCQRCDSVVSVEDIYCRNCGLQLEYKDSAAQEEAQSFQQYTVTEEKLNSIEEKSSTSTKNNRVMLGILIAVILCFIVSYFVNRSDNDNRDNNQYNSAYMVNSGRWKYFSYTPVDISIKENKDKGGIYKLNKYETKAAKICEDTAISLTVEGNWIYYSSDKEGKRSIYKMKTDGSEKALLIKDSGTYLTVYRNYLYYLGSSGERILYRVSLNGGERQKLAENVSDFYIVKEKVYYTTTPLSAELGKVLKINLDGKSKEEVCKFIGRIEYINNNYIYYIEPSISEFMQESKDFNSINYLIGTNTLFDGGGNLYRMTIDGEKRERIISDNVKRLIIKDKHIFYTVFDGKETKNYRSDMNGKNKKEIKVNPLTSCDIDLDSIYYVNPEDNKIYKSSLDKKNVKAIEVK